MQHICPTGPTTHTFLCYNSGIGGIERQARLNIWNFAAAKPAEPE